MKEGVRERFGLVGLDLGLDVQKTGAETEQRSKVSGAPNVHFI